MLATSAMATASAHAAPVAGINAHLLGPEMTSEEVTRQFGIARDLGAKILRVDVGWASLQETGPDTYTPWYVKRLDALVATADAHGVKPVFSFAYSPCWASSAPESARQNCAGAWWDRGVMRYAPRDPEAYGRAMAWLAARYGTRVAAYEVWNEPNSSSFFKSPDPVRDYTAMAKAAYRLVKAAAPEVTVLVGSLQTSDSRFAEAMFEAGLGRDFDGFSIHPYTGDIDPNDPLPGWTKDSFIAGPPAVREVLVRHGAADKKLWLTEAGWSACLRRDGEHWENGVDEDVQAKYLREAFRIAASWDYVEALIWYDLIDDSDNPWDMWGQAGLLRHDGSKRPAYDAFLQVASGSAGGPENPASEAPGEAVAPAPAAPAPSVKAPAPKRGKRAGKARAALWAPLKATVRKRGKRLIIRGRASSSARVRIKVVSKPRRASARSARVRARVAVLRADRRGRFSLRMTKRRAAVVRISASGARVARYVGR